MKNEWKIEDDPAIVLVEGLFVSYSIRRGARVGVKNEWKIEDDPAIVLAERLSRRVRFRRYL